MNKDAIKKMCIAGIFAALVFVFTAYLHVPQPLGGYTHVGDGFIYLAACLLPLPYALGASAVGAALADLIFAPAWAPGTILIKMLTVLVFSRKSERVINGRNLLALLPAWAICIGGYYLYEALLFGGFEAALVSIPGNAIQCAFSAVLFVLLGLVFDKAGLRKRLGI